MPRASGNGRCRMPRGRLLGEVAGTGAADATQPQASDNAQVWRAVFRFALFRPARAASFSEGLALNFTVAPAFTATFSPVFGRPSPRPPPAPGRRGPAPPPSPVPGCD